jgi:hypothetical protein
MLARRKKRITNLFLLMIEITFVVLTLRVITKPLRPDRLPSVATHITQVRTALTRGLSLEVSDGHVNLSTKLATLQSANRELLASIMAPKTAHEPRPGCDSPVPLLRLLSRLKIPVSGSDDLSVIG